MKSRGNEYTGKIFAATGKQAANSIKKPKLQYQEKMVSKTY
jgi:hypothetical protein